MSVSFTQSECVDCGARSRVALCAACARVAAALGHTVDERVAKLDERRSVRM